MDQNVASSEVLTNISGSHLWNGIHPQHIDGSSHPFHALHFFTSAHIHLLHYRITLTNSLLIHLTCMDHKSNAITQSVVEEN